MDHHSQQLQLNIQKANKRQKVKDLHTW